MKRGEPLLTALARQPRPCACGCGALVVIKPGHRHRKYATDACRQYAYRVRRGKVWGDGMPRQDGRAVRPEPAPSAVTPSPGAGAGG